MRFRKYQVLLTCLTLFIVHASRAQTGNEYFSPLSSTSYTARISAIKGRSIPVVYENKKEQKTYAGIIKDRNEGIIEDLEHDRIVFDTMLLNKSNSIIQRIKAANKGFIFD